MYLNFFQSDPKYTDICMCSPYDGKSRGSDRLRGYAASSTPGYRMWIVV